MKGDGIAWPRVEGVAARQAHADLPAETFERELGRNGFFGPASHMVHRHAPTGWMSVDGPLRPRAFDLNALAAKSESPWGSPLLLGNDACALRLWGLLGDMRHLVRNADGDELLFVHQGEGVFFCDYGRLPFACGDYIAVPRGTMWRIEAHGETRLLSIEATGSSYRLPDKGLLGAHAIFDPAMLRTPSIDEAFRAQQEDAREWRVVVKKGGATTTITFPFNPLDALGWQGTLSVAAINWRALRPLMSHRYHLPPSAHTTFVSDRFVVCTFCPRPIESDPGALKVPFFHSNDDFDEVIFYHRGNFFSRDNICAGMMTWHPSGIPHGPHPKAFATGAEAGLQHTDEVAVMIDTRDPLEATSLARGVEDPSYVDSWRQLR